MEKYSKGSVDHGPDNFSIPSQETNYLKGMHLWITKMSGGRFKTVALS